MTRRTSSCGCNPASSPPGSVDCTRGLWTRPVILLTWLPFNLTLPFLGWVELVGHLPTYGTMVVLLLWGAGQDLTPYIRAVERAEARLDEAAEREPARDAA